MDSFVVGAELEIERALVEDLAIERLASVQLDFLASDTGRRSARHGGESAEMRDQIGHFLRGQIESWHAGSGASHAKERGELGGATGCDLGLDVGAAFASGRIGAMASGTAGFVFTAAGIGLGGGNAEGGETEKYQARESHAWNGSQCSGFNSGVTPSASG